MPELPAHALGNPHDADLKPSVLPRFMQLLGVGVFLLSFVVASVFALTEHWRRATFTLGAAMMWLAVLRVSCDSKILGILSVRSRRFDALFNLLLGGGLVFLSSSIDSLGS
ncbi:hypothetical protein COCCU_02845 [Corynebacterium occultum]|uniref:DUF3017 domain-containing protein n=1 Tax=Corynebacterium occultum TaxID=2675219 RepID=A0A6B8VQY9_9CORY|nr:DUF3017 domain-containing protein [Corynebacterium occultum]QGU06523.1 hypothetical protein COCCU_02845 [Corynebacterium occultum]